MNGQRLPKLFLTLLEGIEKDTVMGTDRGERSLDAYEGCDPEAVLLHYALLIEAGYIKGNIDWLAAPAKVFAQRLTWTGYDYIDELRHKQATKRLF